MLICLEKNNGIGHIILNRPERHNALNATGYVELRDMLRVVSTDPEVKVVILKGAGKSFSAGSDVNEFLKDDIAALRAHFRVVAEVFKGMSECKKLIIAAVQGYALGGGCGLTAAADFAIASVDAQFGLPEVDLDIFPMTIMPPIVRAVSMRKALELLFLGERVNAQEAKQIGLVNQVVPKEELYCTAEALAGKLSLISNLALEMGKEAYQISQSMEYFSAIDYLSNIMAIVTGHAQAQQSITDFLDRKKSRKKADS